DPDRGLARDAPRTPHPGPRSRGLARGWDSRRTSRPPARLRQERAAPGAARRPDLPQRRQARLRRSNPQHPRFRSAPPTRPLGPSYLLRPQIGPVFLLGAGPARMRRARHSRAPPWAAGPELPRRSGQDRPALPQLGGKIAGPGPRTGAPSRPVGWGGRNSEPRARRSAAPVWGHGPPNRREQAARTSPAARPHKRDARHTGPAQSQPWPDSRAGARANQRATLR